VGVGSVRALAAGSHRLHHPAARSLREKPDLDRGPQAHALPRYGQEHALERLCRRSRLCVRRRDGRLYHFGIGHS
jgi:hypothetical protein